MTWIEILCFTLLGIAFFFNGVAIFYNFKARRILRDLGRVPKSSYQ